MSNIYVRTLEKWKSVGVSLVSTEDRAVVERRLQKAGLQFGNDFLEFYATVGGMDATDSDLWSCWSIEKILQENESYEREGVLFADWCIHSHIHLARRESAFRSSVWVDFSHEPEKVADSLDDFLERYLAKDETIYIYFDEPSIRNRTS